VNYYNLKAILSAAKGAIPLQKPASSFGVAGDQTRSYIEPTFEKVIFETEKPTILLVSAVGATGKTALAQQLSHDTSLPLLDLGKHKPVGAHTLTGLLTQAFDVAAIGGVFSGLASGAFGVIIDGVDEGRSKTTEKAFDAFLDDICNLCRSQSPTTFVLLGRTQVIEDCWVYLSEKGIPTGLVTISPFTIDQGKKYIDTFTSGATGAYPMQYASARDTILDKLSKAFAGNAEKQTDDFLSFIGYPPVLDAIVTVLREEPNYHKLLQELAAPAGANVEVSMLNRIAQYVLLRERDLKVVPNIITPLMEEAPDPLRQKALSDLCTVEEQCARLVAHCIGRQLTLARLGEPIFDEQYETRVTEWLLGHPFIRGREFRNDVFEALALATLVVSKDSAYAELAEQYLTSHKHSYHFVYMLDIVSSDHRIPAYAIGALFAAAMEFRSVRSNVYLRLDGPDWDGEMANREESTEVGVEVEIFLGAEGTDSQVFEFSTGVTSASRLLLGSKLGGAFVYVPCSVELGGRQELELTAPVEIAAKSLTLNASELILRTPPHKEGESEVLINVGTLRSHLHTVTTNGVALAFSLEDMTGVSYPVIGHAEKRSQAPADPLLWQKYLRFKRILMEFRSHSKGALAKYRHKIEHERVLKNAVGEAVLRKLTEDQILSLQGPMYYLDPDKLSAAVGISWLDLRKGRMPEPLYKYLTSIE
jgi:hypothetical protein